MSKHIYTPTYTYMCIFYTHTRASARYIYVVILKPNVLLIPRL